MRSVAAGVVQQTALTPQNVLCRTACAPLVCTHCRVALT
jgi:hypothetical protein